LKYKKALSQVDGEGVCGRTCTLAPLSSLAGLGLKVKEKITGDEWDCQGEFNIGQ
jgi:hypothetical protein